MATAREPRASDRVFARTIAATYADPVRESRLTEAEIARDAVWFLTSPDADVREMGLYALSLGPPALIAELYARLRGHDRALDDIGRLVQAELSLLERPDDEWRSLERVVQDDPQLREAWPTLLRDEIASRKQWANALFDALGDDAGDLQRRVAQVERRTLAGAYAKRR